MSDTSITVRLPPPLKHKIQRAARLHGIGVSDLIREAAEEKSEALLQTETLADALKDYVGAFEGSASGSSGRVDEVIMEMLEEKRRAGKL